jgi:hypothetical protein
VYCLEDLILNVIESLVLQVWLQLLLDPHKELKDFLKEVREHYKSVSCVKYKANRTPHD